MRGMMRFVGPGSLMVLLAACATTPPPAPAPRPMAQTPAPAPVAQAPAPKPQPPAWTPRKVVADAVEVPAASVTVTAGDSLGRIAARFGVSPGAIAAENGLASPFTIKVGQTLRIPGGRYHRVKPGETGIAIARAYGVKWGDVVTANALEAPFTLAAGQRLRLPGAKEVAAMSLEQRAEAFKVDIDDLVTGSEPAAATPPRPRPQRPAATQSARVTPPAATPPAVTPPAAAASAPPKAVAQAPLPRRQPPSKPLVEPAAFSGRFSWPLEGRVISTFGPKPGGRYNDGINIKATAGAPVRAAADGVVAYAGDGLEGFGGLVLIRHGDGWVTAYAHNEELLVSRGQAVKRGDIVARAGATGSVDEPQLHFEIRRGRNPVNPLTMLPPRTSS
ncbi:MAG: LysM peptidoglycan-binding domain-containing M23 family metallopeptidase [Alphaproteobacteria bacterium]|nr:LysM peptidoglycan-binding domain-containing M23 family metallopeptidase [Alphaproteobacteria bacterium]